MPVPATLIRQALRKLHRRSRQVSDEARYRHSERYLETTVGAYTGEGERVLEHLFNHQLKLIRDPSRRKAARCGRRAGKTTTAAAYLVRECLNRPGALCGYLTITSKQAQRLIWPELKRLNRHYKLGITFKLSDLVAHFPNGSEIWVAGADKLDQIEKFRGIAFLLVVLDETASFKAYLEQLVEEVLEPTLEDYSGTVMMIGTPSRACAGMFYDATMNVDSGWSKHHWTVLDNPLFPKWRRKRNWRQRAKNWLKAKKIEKNWDDDDPILNREWLALWVRDHGSMVYKWDPEKNRYRWTTASREGYEWFYILGVDLGHDDATAFVVVAFSPDVPWCQFVRSEKKSGMDITDVAKRIRQLQDEYGPLKTVVDTGALGKMIVEEMRRRHHLALIAAEKKDKLAFQEAMNADFRKGLIHVDPTRCGTLITEWEALQKDDSGHEDDRFPNDCADAGLYAWREARHYRHEPVEEQPKAGTDEYYDKLEQELIEADEADLEEPDEVEALFG